MGKKLSWEDAEKLGRLEQQEDTIFSKPNSYGYQLNVNSPRVRPFYDRYKEKLGERILSDKQRLHFEAVFLKMCERNDKSDKTTG